MMMGMETMMLNKQQQQQQGSANWWWLDSHYNNDKNRDVTRRSSWLQFTLSETTSMLKLIEADADSFAQRAEMYYRKRSDLIAVVEEFYRMHRTLAERFDQLKSESAKQLLMTLGSPFSCNEQQVPPLKKSLLLSPGMYKYCDTCSDSSDDHEDNPDSEVEDPEEDNRIEPTSLKDKSGWKSVALDTEALTRGDGNYEIQKSKEEAKRLRKEISTLRDKMARKDAEHMQALGQMSISIYEIERQRDQKARHEEQKVEMMRELTLSTGEIKRLKEQNDYRRCEEIVPKVNTIQGGRFLRRLFPKSSKKSKATSALSFGTFH